MKPWNERSDVTARRSMFSTKLSITCTWSASSLSGASALFSRSTKFLREQNLFLAPTEFLQLSGNEIVGTSGEAPEHIQIVANVDEAQRAAVPTPEKVVLLTQTTLSVDDTREIIDTLKQRFPKLITAAKEDICYATQNRQDAVKQLASEVDLVLVIGSRNSENSNQLCNVAKAHGKPAYLIDDYHAIDSAWLDGIKRVGITSGASVPERLVEEAAEYFRKGGAEISQNGFTEENIHFALPTEIADVP